MTHLSTKSKVNVVKYCQVKLMVTIKLVKLPFFHVSVNQFFQQRKVRKFFHALTIQGVLRCYLLQGGLFLSTVVFNKEFLFRYSKRLMFHY